MTNAVQASAVDPAIGNAMETYQRLNAIRNVLAPDLNDQELQLFALVAQRSRLDPFAKQIYAIKRGGRVTFQTGIDGFRSSAEETDEYRGSDEPEFGPMVDKPFPHPEWARVIVHRQFKNGDWLHQPATVYWDELYPGDQQGQMWKKMPRGQLAKCAEAAAFRKAFPKRFADVYTAEEMQQADAVDAARPVARTARERIAERRAQLEAQAATSLPETPPADPVTGEVIEPDADGVELGDTAAAQPTPTGNDLVTRLKRVAYANHDRRARPATDEQKAQLRDLFGSIDPAVIASLLERAFESTPVTGRDNKVRFQVNQAEAQALLEVASVDPERFTVEAVALAGDVAT